MSVMPQAIDFRDESDALYALLKPVEESRFQTATQFKGWTIDDVLQHLHYFNWMAEISLLEPEKFKAEYAAFSARRAETDFLVATNERLGGLKGKALLETWRETVHKVADSFAPADPKQRVEWAGPSMSARSSITARLMETWAHGQEVYDELGVERQDTDRIRNIAHLGVSTYGWTFATRQETAPEPVPFVRLTAPSGAIWEWGEPSETERVEGSATEFCQVVAQTRNIADTKLSVTGPNATRWMSIAQCFAGPPNPPPAPGTRFRRGGS